MANTPRYEQNFEGLPLCSSDDEIGVCHAGEVASACFGTKESKKSGYHRRHNTFVGLAVSRDFYSILGFTSNPFENNTAEREPDIAAYAVKPPYLDRVLQSSYAKGIFVLNGTRGSGKSATRLTVAKTLWSRGGGPLVVPVVGFNVFKPYSKAPIPLELYANQIAFLTVETILGWLSSISEDHQKAVLGRLTGDQQSFVRKIVGNFYLSRDEFARSASANECCQSLDISLVQKGLLWMEKRWDAVATSVATLAVRLGEKYFELDVGNPDTYAQLLKKQAQAGFGDPVFVFSKAVEFARLFGFSGIAVHVDKVDETDWTSNDAGAAASLVYPILANIQLHEIDGLTWSFFLWDKVRDAVSPPNFYVRWDKIPNGEISWSIEYLNELVSRRIAHFSRARLNSLREISVKETDIDQVMIHLIGLAEQSPRNLISLLDVVLSEHIQRNQHEHELLDDEAFQKGMDVYVTRSLANSGHTAIAEQIAKVETTRFATRDVSARFGIGPQAARGRIEAWVQAGLVQFDGSSVGPQGGRPVDFFAVHDPRVKRVIDRHL